MGCGEGEACEDEVEAVYDIAEMEEKPERALEPTWLLSYV